MSNAVRYEARLVRKRGRRHWSKTFDTREGAEAWVAQYPNYLGSVIERAPKPKPTERTREKQRAVTRALEAMRNAQDFAAIEVLRASIESRGLMDERAALSALKPIARARRAEWWEVTVEIEGHRYRRGRPAVCRVSGGRIMRLGGVALARGVDWSFEGATFEAALAQAKGEVAP